MTVVSPDSFTSPQADQTVTRGNQPAGYQDPNMGQSFFHIRVTIDKVGLHDTPPGFAVSPGQPITADVMVGKNTMLKYLFNRVLPVAQQGMREP